MATARAKKRDPSVELAELVGGTVLDRMLAIFEGPLHVGVTVEEGTEALLPYREKYFNDPVGFIEVELGITLTEQQKEICRSVVENRETNVQASHSIGKSFVAACITYWWTICRGMVVTTAPTGRQVNEVLWKEIRRFHSRFQKKFATGICLQVELRFSESHRAWGFAGRDYDPDAFNGIHEENLLGIQDEASGIKPMVDEGMASCLTGEGNRMLRIGNPVRNNTPFRKHCSEKNRGNFKLHSFTHPNVSWAYERHPDGEYRLKPDVDARLPRDDDGRIRPVSEWPEDLPRPLVPAAVSISWIESERNYDKNLREKGPRYRRRVMGEFVEDSSEGLIPRDWFHEARSRYDEDPEHWDSMADPHPWCHGLDVGDGSDPHSIASRRGPVLYAAQEHPTRGDREDVDRAIGIGLRALREMPGCIHVDRIGVGAGALSGLISAGANAHEVANGGQAERKDLYENVRAEDHWELRELFRTGQIAIAPLGEDEERLMDELAAIQYEETRTGRIRMEEKAQVKKRLKRSPNLADGVVMCFRAYKDRKKKGGLVAA